MAHKTLISGTAYSVTGGRELIGGTGYGCKAGKTIIGGTAFDVPIGSPKYTLTIQNANISNGAYVAYVGENYGTGTLRITVGDTVKILVSSNTSGVLGNVSAKLNGAGTLVYKGINGLTKSYEYTPAANATIKFSRTYSGKGAWYQAVITEE